MNDDLKTLVLRMFAILDIEEESDSGRVFHPTTIRSCRAGDAAQLEVILERMKALVDYEPKEPDDLIKFLRKKIEVLTKENKELLKGYET